MAEAIVCVVMEQLGSIIQLELEQEVRQVVGVRQEVSKLTSTLGFIKAVLDDAEKKQFHESTVKVWIRALKDIMYDADDVLDEWYTTISISQSRHMGATGGSRTTSKVFSFFFSPCSCFPPVFVRHNIAHIIKDIRARLDDVSRDKEQLNLLQSSEDNRPRQLTSSIVDESEIQGRDHDKASILSRVLPENSDQGTQAPVPIICIVGMGGLGKTTLAQLVFKNEHVTATFERKIWVCVSQPFDLERVAKEIIVQASEENVHDVVGWEVLHQRLCSSVKGKRFLLILDDVWTENPRDWTPMKVSLDGGAAGSRIIITTRSEGVAKIVGSSYTHPLKELSEDHCWSLFQHIAFQGRSQQEIGRLEETGREIANKCKGVPLAAKTVGSLMRFKQTKQEWRSVLQSDIWELGKDFFPALQLSYHSLPAHIKQCFLYTAIFPKDTRLKRDRLVKLWMAQGFIRSLGGVEPEMVAGEYFDDLAMRSFFQDFERDDDDGKVISCKMHDFLHDVAQSLTKDECLIKEMNEFGLTNCNKVRHVNASNTECSSPFVAKNLRTLILKSSTPTQVLRRSFLQSTCLRALDLHGYDLIELPREVKCLVHLRYLDLSDTMLSILPKTLCNLYNLQTLKLNGCQQLGRLPETIGRLSNLRHIEVEGTWQLEYFPQSIGKLSQLRTLHKFVVSGTSKGCKVGELRQLNFLSGALQIYKLNQVENMDESKGAQILKKKNLGRLRLDFDYSMEEQAVLEIVEVKRMEGVLEGLQPNAYLEKLKIRNYPGMIFPFWISSKSLLCHIVTLKLSGCRNCIQLPALGNLESLESLYIYRLESVKHIGAEFYGVGGDTCFPKLKSLQLVGMPKWEDWEIPFSKFIKVMPRLCRLVMQYCASLKGLPGLGRLESLEIIEMNDLDLVKEVGSEFLGISSSDGGDGGEYMKPQTTVFPMLRRLIFNKMEGWEEWNLPQQQMNNVEIMPRLSELRIESCRKLKALPGALGQLPSLEEFCLICLDAMKHVGVDHVQIPNGSAASRSEEASTSALLSPNVVLFPKLTKLTLDGFPQWVKEEHCEETSRIYRKVASIASIMPCLHWIRIVNCPKLKVLPHYMFPRSLRILELWYCPQLKVIPSLPPLLEEMYLCYDLGVVSKSLMSSSCDHDYPNLKFVKFFWSPHSSLPQGLSKFTSLQRLEIGRCKFLNLKPEDELRGFPTLQQLLIYKCPVISERCEREDWVNTLSSHIAYNIEFEVYEERISFTKRR